MKLSGALLASVLAAWAVATPLAIPTTFCSDSVSVNSVHAGLPPPCMLICASESLECPDGWDVEKFGDCNTCCMKGDVITDQRLAHSNGDKASKSISVNNEVDGSAICHQKCIPEEFKCSAGWHSEHLGQGCWACCVDNSSIEITDQRLAHSNGDKASKSISVNNSDNGSGLCLLICAYEKLECHAGWHAKAFGDCWTCCKDDDPTVIAKVASHEVTKPELAQVNDGAACWVACFPEKPDCPPSGTPFHYGESCWSCCFGGDGNAAVEKSHLVGQSHLGL